MRGLKALAAVSLTMAVTGAPAQTVAVEPPHLEFAFEEIVRLGAPIPVGKTGLGERNIVPITGGTFEGAGLRGTIIPGGWDWQLRRPDGCLHIKADYMLRTDDGAVINVLNQGLFCPKTDGKGSGGRTVASFEPPLGKYQWLGQAPFIGTIEPLSDPNVGAIRIRFYRVL